MAEELLLSSTRVLPEKLQDSGYEFLYSDIDKALTAYLQQ
jgi:NAD dependent epimerase/dehydratase family enzyme